MLSPLLLKFYKHWGIAPFANLIASSVLPPSAQKSK